jgi:hypothetical protein
MCELMGTEGHTYWQTSSFVVPIEVPKAGRVRQQAHQTRPVPGSPSGGNFGPRLRHGVINTNLQHRKPRFQFAGSVGGAFYRDELRF